MKNSKLYRDITGVGGRMRDALLVPVLAVFTALVISGFIIAGSALALLSWGPGEPSTTDPSTSMTMARQKSSWSPMT